VRDYVSVCTCAYTIYEKLCACVCRVLVKETFWKGSTTWPPPRRCIHRQLFLRTPPFCARVRVCVCILAGSRILVRVWVSVWATELCVPCKPRVHYVVVLYPAGQGCSERAALRGRRCMHRRAKRPAPSPTVCDSRRDRPKRALDVLLNGSWRPIAASARILDTLGQPRIPGRQLPSPPFCTGGGGVPPPATLRRVVFHRCARIIHGDDVDACVRECVRARVRTTCRFGKPFDYIILIYYTQIIIIIIIYYNKLVTKTNNITRTWNTLRVFIVVFGT